MDKKIVFGMCGLMVATCAADVTLSAGSVEVVAAPKAPDVTLFAAEEMTNFLSRVLNAPVPLVTALTDGKASIVLGTNVWSTAAGIDPARLKRDGFVIKCDPAARRIYVAGCDDPKYGLRKAVASNSWGTMAYERATVFATYDFLERFAGVRFYFPGEMGTVVPRKDKIGVPAGETKSEPDWRCRIIFSHEFGEWPDNLTKKEVGRLSRLEQLRLRHQTESFNSCHGQYHMNLAKRFGKTHPEYFTLTKDGGRRNNPSSVEVVKLWKSQQLCQSSKVWDEMYEDAKSYFLGEPPDKRGVVSGFDDKAKVAWGDYCRYRKYYDVMPNDSHPCCYCLDCQAEYAKAPDPKFPMSELVWRQTAKLANRLKAEGIPGTILQAAYAQYRAIPSVDIPDNVIVSLCLPGPWTEHEGAAALQREYEEVGSWSRKVDGRLWMWIYMGKYRCFMLDFPGIPNTTPRALARYLKKVAPHVLGVFPEPFSDYFIFHFLDLYVYSRIAWDNGCDAEAILSEHFRLMYGDGAGAVEEIFDLLENLWIRRIVGKKSPTPWGYSYDTPDAYTTFTEIYSPAMIARLEGLYAKALAAVPDDSMEARRISYVCSRLLGPLTKRACDYLVSISPAAELGWRNVNFGKSLLKNGSFDSAEGWADNSGRNTFSVDTNVFFSAPSALRISTSDDSPMKGGKYCRASAMQTVKLKPSTKYRLSGFIKIDDVRPVCVIGGVNFLVSGPVDKGFPDRWLATGTRDWHAFAYEFTTPGDYEGEKKANVGPRLIHASGTVWVDDIRLVELGQADERCQD